MIPDGFGDPITGFENPYRQADPHTSYLTVGHTPPSTSSRPAFAFGSHDDSFFGELNTASLFYTCHIKLHPAFLAYPFLTNHLSYESLLPLARYWRL